MRHSIRILLIFGDRVSLGSSDSMLNTILPVGDSGFQQDVISSLRELHMRVIHLSIDWETQLQCFHNGLPQHRAPFGRPNISLNVPMLCVLPYY